MPILGRTSAKCPPEGEKKPGNRSSSRPSATARHSGVVGPGSHRCDDFFIILDGGIPVLVVPASQSGLSCPSLLTSSRQESESHIDRRRKGFCEGEAVAERFFLLHFLVSEFWFGSFCVVLYFCTFFALLANIGAAHQGGLRSSLTSYRYTYTFTEREREKHRLKHMLLATGFNCIGGIHTSFFGNVFIYLNSGFGSCRFFIVVNHYYYCC
ncbi:hypothetical protein F5X96DRAFT_635271 [Biscogniauxia mediterranea]|nr:hypothetical protein F5X96DRAFT_635271 [Biscogniauxia mediterranea]